MTRTLVIAYGNSLRGDDGVGVATGARIEQWQGPGVAVVAVQQLVPELIAEIGAADRVLFVDASETYRVNAPFALVSVGPEPSDYVLGHHETPGRLLALAEKL